MASGTMYQFRIGDWMILSNLIFDKSWNEQLFKISIDDLREIIKTENIIEKDIMNQAQCLRRNEIE